MPEEETKTEETTVKLESIGGRWAKEIDRRQKQITLLRVSQELIDAGFTEGDIDGALSYVKEIVAGSARYEPNRSDKTATTF